MHDQRFGVFSIPTSNDTSGDKAGKYTAKNLRQERIRLRNKCSELENQILVQQKIIEKQFMQLQGQTTLLDHSVKYINILHMGVNKLVEERDTLCNTNVNQNSTTKELEKELEEARKVIKVQAENITYLLAHYGVGSSSEGERGLRP